MPLELPPQLILPSHYAGNRPAIIRPELDLARYFPVQISRGERRAILAELRRAGRTDANLPGMVPVVVGGGLAPFSWAFRGSHTDTANATTYSGGSWDGISIGDAPTGLNKRFGIAVINSQDDSGTTARLASASAGGAMSPVDRTAAGVNIATAIMIVELPTGTTVNLSATFDGPIGGAQYAFYTMINPGAGLTAHAITKDETHASGVIDLGLNVPAGGFAVAGCQGRNNAAMTLSWSGVTQRVNADLESTEMGTIGDTSTSGSPVAITCTSSDTTPQNMVGISASWGP